LTNDQSASISLNSTQAIREVLRTGDRNALERLAAIYRPYLQSIASQMMPATLKGRLDSSDLVQEVLLRGTSQLTSFQGETDAEFAGWLKGILQNLIIDLTRHHTAEKRDVRREVSDDRPIRSQRETPSSIFKQREERERVMAALLQFPEEQQLAVKLRSEGKTFKEIGRTLDRTEDAVRMLWARAIKRLLNLMEDHG